MTLIDVPSSLGISMTRRRARVKSITFPRWPMCSSWGVKKSTKALVRVLSVVKYYGRVFTVEDDNGGKHAGIEAYQNRRKI